MVRFKSEYWYSFTREISWQTLSNKSRQACSPQLILTQRLELMPSCFIPVSSYQSQGLISLLLVPHTGEHFHSLLSIKGFEKHYEVAAGKKKLVSSTAGIVSARQASSRACSSCPIITHNAETITFTTHRHVRWIPVSWLRRRARHKRHHIRTKQIMGWRFRAFDSVFFLASTKTTHPNVLASHDRDDTLSNYQHKLLHKETDLHLSQARVVLFPNNETTPSLTGGSILHVIWSAKKSKQELKLTQWGLLNNSEVKFRKLLQTPWLVWSRRAWRYINKSINKSKRHTKNRNMISNCNILYLYWNFSMAADLNGHIADHVLIN